MGRTVTSWPPLLAACQWRLLRFQNVPHAPRELFYVRRRAVVPKVLGGEPAYDAKVVAAIKAP